MDGSSYIPDEAVWAHESCQSAQKLFEEQYDRLLRLARSIRRRRLSSDTFLTGDLLHDAYLKLQDDLIWRDKEHFLASMALAMRHVLISHARARNAAKRGGGQAVESLDEIEVGGGDAETYLERILDVGSCLKDLAEDQPRLVQVIDCRFYAGYTEEETADLLGVTSRTVRRDWDKARAYLKLRLDHSDATTA